MARLLLLMFVGAIVSLFAYGLLDPFRNDWQSIDERVAMRWAAAPYVWVGAGVIGGLIAEMMWRELTKK